MADYCIVITRELNQGNYNLEDILIKLEKDLRRYEFHDYARYKINFFKDSVSNQLSGITRDYPDHIDLIEKIKIELEERIIPEITGRANPVCMTR